jgi:hypothetical protein
MVRLNNRWRKVPPCPINTYGVPEVTYSLQASPCRPCPIGLITDAPNGTTGATSPSSCYNRAGWGWDLDISSPCQDNSFAPEHSMDICKACGDHRYTLPGAQASADDCLVLPGFGLANNGQLLTPPEVSELVNPAVADVVQCPVTHYGPGSKMNSLCLPCPARSSASSPGATQLSDCNGKLMHGCGYPRALG